MIYVSNNYLHHELGIYLICPKYETFTVIQGFIHTRAALLLSPVPAVPYLAHQQPGETPLILGAQNGSLECVAALLENADTDVTATNVSPVHAAAGPRREQRAHSERENGRTRKISAG